MWTTLSISVVIFLMAVRIFFMAHYQAEVISAALIATACGMIALGVTPPALQLTLLLIIAAVEWWLFYCKPASES